MSNLFFGDALAVLNVLEDESVDFVLTDPPYFINEEVSVIRRGNVMKYKGKNRNFFEGTEWDRQWGDKEEYYNWIDLVMTHLVRVLKADRHLVIWCDKKNITVLANIGERLGCKFRTPWWWQKTNPCPQARKVSPNKTIEAALWFTKGKPKQNRYNWQLGMVNDVITAPVPQKQGAEKRHPTQKPLKAALLLVAFLSKPGNLVLDPFCGAGTFLKAAQVLGREFLGVEKNKEWVEVARKRLQSDGGAARKEAEKLKQELLRVKPKVINREEFDKLFGLEIKQKELFE